MEAVELGRSELNAPFSSSTVKKREGGKMKNELKLTTYPQFFSLYTYTLTQLFFWYIKY